MKLSTALKDALSYSSHKLDRAMCLSPELPKRLADSMAIEARAEIRIIQRIASLMGETEIVDACDLR
jgi:hypothetical protein